MSHGGQDRLPNSDLELALLRLAWRLDALDEWRIQITDQVASNRRELERLMKADEIADAVTDKLRQEQGEMFTKGSFHLSERQTQAGIIGVAVAALGICVTTLLTILHSVGVL